MAAPLSRAVDVGLRRDRLDGGGGESPSALRKYLIESAHTDRVELCVSSATSSDYDVRASTRLILRKTVSSATASGLIGGRGPWISQYTTRQAAIKGNPVRSAITGRR